jgi:hypothetical protein
LHSVPDDALCRAALSVVHGLGTGPVATDGFDNEDTEPPRKSATFACALVAARLGYVVQPPAHVAIDHLTKISPVNYMG